MFRKLFCNEEKSLTDMGGTFQLQKVTWSTLHNRAALT